MGVVFSPGSRMSEGRDGLGPCCLVRGHVWLVGSSRGTKVGPVSTVQVIREKNDLGVCVVHSSSVVYRTLIKTRSLPGTDLRCWKLGRVQRIPETPISSSFFDDELGVVTPPWGTGVPSSGRVHSLPVRVWGGVWKWDRATVVSSALFAVVGVVEEAVYGKSFPRGDTQV